MPFKTLSKKNKHLLVIIEIELLALLFIVLCFSRDILNVGNIVEYANTDSKAIVTAEYGKLSFNEVSVTVPNEGASYVIGYDWAKDDEEYPSVPSSASAYYTDDSGEVTYEVMLYRDKIIPVSDEDGTASLDAWYDEWKQRAGEGTGQEAYKAAGIRGFLIRNTGDSSEDEKTYCSYTFYFAVEADSNIEQYVLEINFYDQDSIDKAEGIFKTCADTIVVNSPVHT